MSRENLTLICTNLGLKDLIKTKVWSSYEWVWYTKQSKINFSLKLKDFPIEEETMESVLFAVIAALSQSSVFIGFFLYCKNNLSLIIFVSRELLELIYL